MSKVKDVSVQIRGVSYKPTDLHDTLNDNSVILLRANNITDYSLNIDDVIYVDKSKVSELQYLVKGDILVCASSGSKNLVGKATFIKDDIVATFGAFCKVVRPQKIFPAFLGYYFTSSKYRNTISQLSAGANINNIKNEHIDSLNINIPVIEHQREIASTLDKVTHTIDLCNQIIEKLDLLVKARFVEMFGDPVSNPMSWQTKPLLSIGKCKNGMNFHYDDNGVEINSLGVGDFKDLSIITDTSALPKISLNEMPTDEYLLKNNDIVFVRSNGNKALVGRSLAVYPNDIPTTFSGFCIRFRKDDNSILIPYLLRVLKTDSIRMKMAGRGANIQNLNQQILSTLDIPVPPLELQQKFADFMEQNEKSKSAVKKVLEKSETLKKALMQEYFG